MKAIVCTKYGPLEALQLRRDAQPKSKPKVQESAKVEEKVEAEEVEEAEEAEEAPVAVETEDAEA